MGLDAAETAVAKLEHFAIYVSRWVGLSTAQSQARSTPSGIGNTRTDARPITVMGRTVNTVDEWTVDGREGRPLVDAQD